MSDGGRVGARDARDTRARSLSGPLARRSLTAIASYLHHRSVSKPPTYDALLVRALAAELTSRCSGRRVHWIRFEPERRTVVVNVGRNALRWDLDPRAGALTVEPARTREAGVTMPRAARIAGVSALPDDRILVFDLEVGGDGPLRGWQLWIELLPNRRNAVLLAADGRVIAELAARPDTGRMWEPPAARPRDGWDRPLERDAFVALLAPAPPAARERALLAGVAYTSPINALAILGEAADIADPVVLESAWQRYRSVVDADLRQAVLLEIDGGQPYPVPLPGVDATTMPDLLTAFAQSAAVVASTTTDRDAVLRALDRRAQHVEKQAQRMRAQLAGARDEADRARHAGNLILSHLREVRRGMSEIVLADWNGEDVRVVLDPQLDPAANANRMFDTARKRERAAERLPRLIGEAEAKRSRLIDVRDRIARDEAPLDAALPFLPAAVATGARAAPLALPYRRYRTSGGLEVRVGRGARANDELTLRHASPDDIWMHAQGVAGAHVVLRWGRRDENPPAAEIVQAAALAALHSRARTSGTVAVDWTRRKYVRKPRRAPPGQVMVERTRTVFVEPDPQVEERMQWN